MTKLLPLLFIASSCFVTPALATSALTIDERPVSKVMPEGSYQTAVMCPPGQIWNGSRCLTPVATCPARYVTQSSCVNRRVQFCRYVQKRNCSWRYLHCWNTNTPCGMAGTFVR